MPAEPPEGRKVKSMLADAVEATDRHERAKDYLSPAEMARLNRPGGARHERKLDELIRESREMVSRKIACRM